MTIAQPRKSIAYPMNFESIELENFQYENINGIEFMSYTQICKL